MISENTNQAKSRSSHRRINPFEDQWVDEALERDFLLHFNDLLDDKSNVFFLNETIIADLIEDLDENISIQNDGYWWTLARINELALLCAENYANNSEFSLVGDLLINPRLVLVHVSGSNQPVPKKRHVPLSLQFKDVGNNVLEIRNWLKKETLVEVKTEALLPDLFKRLENSGRFDRDYLKSIEWRKQHIAELIGFLAAGGVSDSVSLHIWLESASPVDRKLMKARFCLLDFEWFFEMGRKVREWGNTVSNFSGIFPSATTRLGRLGT
jgi:hypothetical protein